MKNEYRCPHCKAVLNPSVKILLVIGYKKKKGMILLSPQPGNFKSICDQSVSSAVKEGDKVTFSCPVCAEMLTCSKNKDFCELILGGVGQKDRLVEFSRIFGRHATFIIDGDDVASFMGDDEDLDNMNFFGF